MSRSKMTARRRKGKNVKNNRRAGYKLSNNYTTVQKPRFTGLDPHMMITLKYSAVFRPTILTTVALNQIMNLNSVFDPDRTGTGHQPYLFDYMATNYNRYRVLKTRWKISFGSGVVTYNWVVLPTNGLLATAITTQATFEQACELPFAKDGVQSNGAPASKCSGSISLNLLNGCRVVEYLADDRFESQVASSPTELMVLNVAILNSDTVSIIPVYKIDVFYEVDFHDPIIQAQSLSPMQQHLVKELKSTKLSDYEILKIHDVLVANAINK